MKSLEYIYNTPYQQLNRSLLKQFCEEDGVEFNDELVEYLKKTPWNSNTNVIMNFLSEGGGDDSELKVIYLEGASPGYRINTELSSIKTEEELRSYIARAYTPQSNNRGTILNEGFGGVEIHLMGVNYGNSIYYEGTAENFANAKFEWIYDNYYVWLKEDNSWDWAEDN